MAVDCDEVERRFPRRLLLAASAAAAATGLAEVVTPSATAAPLATPWKLGGNSGVNSNGSNFIGPTNPAPLIFKTVPTTNASVTERMRITPTGQVGVGTKTPVARLDVASPNALALRGTTTSSKSTSSAVTGTAHAGTGVTGTSASLYGVKGSGGYAGLRSDGSSYGAICAASGTGSVGAYASGQGYGVYAAGNTYGVFGSAGTYGVYGSGPTGVYGSGSTNGVTGTTTNVNGNAVYGTGGQYGVHGENARTAGTRGDSGYVGAWGQAPTYGVFGLATDAGANQTYGVFGQASNSASFALWAQGNAHVAGTLSKAAGSFKIDHPLDPDHRWLSHSFVESPDMMNVYNGNVVLDADGRAMVELPGYFAALNRDFRYQLTPIGAHAPVFVASKIKDNRFAIAGGTPGLEVSWQVTGIRQDDYAKAHPIVVDTPKSSADRGTRQFVAAGSSARSMRVGPARPEPNALAPQVERVRLPALR